MELVVEWSVIFLILNNALGVVSSGRRLILQILPNCCEHISQLRKFVLDRGVIAACPSSNRLVLLVGQIAHWLRISSQRVIVIIVHLLGLICFNLRSVASFGRHSQWLTVWVVVCLLSGRTSP